MPQRFGNSTDSLVCMQCLVTSAVKRVNAWAHAISLLTASILQYNAMTRHEELNRGSALRGILPDGLVTIVDVNWYGSVAIELTCKDTTGQPGVRLLYRDDELSLVMSSCSYWSPMRIAPDWRTSSTQYPLFSRRWLSRWPVKSLPSQSGILRLYTVSVTRERIVLATSWV